MTEVKSFVISREKWARGLRDGQQLTLLLGEDGRQCCLGIYLSACGLPDSVLRGRTYPAAVSTAVPAWLLHWSLGNSDAALKLATINDAVMPEPERERKIAQRFADQGITVTFED